MRCQRGKGLREGTNKTFSFLYVCVNMAIAGIGMDYHKSVILFIQIYVYCVF
jgi:hypothetical protein